MSLKGSQKALFVVFPIAFPLLYESEPVMEKGHYVESSPGPFDSGILPYFSFIEQEMLKALLKILDYRAREAGGCIVSAILHRDTVHLFVRQGRPRLKDQDVRWMLRQYASLSHLMAKVHPEHDLDIMCDWKKGSLEEVVVLMGRPPKWLIEQDKHANQDFSSTPRPICRSL